MRESRLSAPQSEQKNQQGRPDQGTAQRWTHTARQLEPTDRAGICVARALEEHVLDRLHLLGLITDLERDAAFRFKADYHAAGLTARLCGSYNPVRGSFSVYGGWDERSDEEEEAYARWRRAMRFLQGSLGDIVVSVICYDVTPDASRVRELKCGLKVLVTVYGR